ncbi:hypothetical protein [Halovivax sp.]|nr:hypothetical protein [Halovivax sp.]
MVTAVEFSIPGESFPFGRAFAEIPEADVELERVVPTGDGPCPYV